MCRLSGLWLAEKRKMKLDSMEWVKKEREREVWMGKETMNEWMNEQSKKWDGMG